MEYIKLNPSEQIYGKKNLLYCEMELLTILKRFKRYKKLRKEELALKNLLIRTTNELKDELRKLDELLPEERDIGLRLTASKKTPKRSELEDEIEQIRRKIAELQ